MPALRSRNICKLIVNSGRVRSKSEPFPPAAFSMTSASSHKMDLRTPRIPDIHLPSPQNPAQQAFTFPHSHNLLDSPIPSPTASPSPWDHLALSDAPVTSYPPAQLHFFPPASSGPFALGGLSASTTALKPRVRKDGHVKRPENAFILFRRHRCLERQKQMSDAKAVAGAKQSKPRQADLSKVISQEWKGLPAHERSHWEMLAKEKKEAHEKQFPDYVYRPRKPRNSSESLPVSWKEENNLTHEEMEKSRSSNSEQPGKRFTIVLPTLGGPDVPYDPALAIEDQYQTFTFPHIDFNNGRGPVTPASAWNQYEVCSRFLHRRSAVLTRHSQANMAACKSLQSPRVDIPRASYTPVPVTPLATPVNSQPADDSESMSPMILSPLLMDSPIFPPPETDYLASPFQESDKMPMYQTPMHEHSWTWAGPSPNLDGELSYLPTEYDSRDSPSELGMFEEIDLGFAGDYSLGANGGSA